MRSDGNGERKDRRFLLHVWREPSRSGHTWRGKVYEVSSTLSVASAKFRDLWDFIALRLGYAPDEPGAGETREDE